MLESIHNPQDLRRLTQAETERLAAEIRQTLIDSVAKSGGHLASNLGAVEITLALHRVLNTPRDKIIFDVGHQSYTHKLITGRQALRDTLRAQDGISGFPKRSESEYDAFETGHASTAISAAVGMARARDAQGQGYAIAALVGDGALTGGMCYEALNDAGSRPTPLIMVLNDNEMSIARNVGALSTYLTRLRGSKRWIGAKRSVKRGLGRLPLIGSPLSSALEKVKRSLKLLLVPGEFFEALGFGYLGPIDGHDIPTLERALRDARAMERPVVVHAVTQKGKGYELAERQPERFHGVAPFLIESGETREPAAWRTVSAGEAAGDALIALAEEDERILAVTAAMGNGTGLTRFAKAYPERYFDVGIAEEHAMTLAAGMAAGGMRPVFAVYASFLQRAVDQLLHDICLQNLPVTVLVDRAGFVPGDGATHQGVYDLAMLRTMPNLTIWAPCDAREIPAMLRAAMALPGPCVIRYPKRLPESIGCECGVGRWRRVERGHDVHLVGHGFSTVTARETAAILRMRGIDCAVWAATSLSALDDEAVASMAAGRLVVTIEEEQAAGSLGEAIAAHFAARPGRPIVRAFGIDGIVPGAHTIKGLAAETGLEPEALAARIMEVLGGG